MKSSRGTDHDGGGKAMKVAVLAMLNGSFDPYWRDVEAGVKSAAQHFKIDLEYLTPEGAAAEKEITVWQLAAIERLAKDKDLKSVAVAILNYSRANAAIKTLISAGLPVITFDNDAPDSGRAFFIGTNNQVAGQTCGYQLAKLVGFEGKIVIDTPTMEGYGCIARLAGFRSGISRYDKIEIVKTVCGGEDPDIMRKAADATVKQIPDLRGIFCAAGTSAKVNASAVERAGKAGKIQIVSIDADADILRAVKNGTINMTLAQRPLTMGNRVMSYLYEIAVRGFDSVMKSIPESRMIDTGIQKITKDNIAAYEETMKRQGQAAGF
jgi:ribose transport system substrate-binding protein